MKALMTNSAQPDIYTAKMRDQTYIRHLREVQKINNRQNMVLKTQIKEYNLLSESMQKHRKQAKQFGLNEHNSQLDRKNLQMIHKMKNIRSMYNFNLKRPAELDQSNLTPNESSFSKQVPKNDRYQKQNQEKQQISQINQLISQSIAYRLSRIQKNESPKSSRLSLHYYLRKRQQEMIEHENEKLKRGILSQKSTYSSPVKNLNRSVKLPGVKSARHNFNQRTMQIYSSKVQKEIPQVIKIIKKTQSPHQIKAQ